MIFIHRNSPVESEYVLNCAADIDRAVHTPDRRMLDAKTVESITNLLSDQVLN